MNRLFADRRRTLGIFLITAALYVPGLTWGLPYATGADRVRTWATDEIAPLGALVEVHRTVSRSRPPDRWLAYPLMHHFTLAVFYLPYLGWLWMTGGFGAPTAEFPYGFADPAASLMTLTLIARVVSVAMAAATVAIVYRIGHTLWGPRAGWIAAVAYGASYPVVYYAKTANLETPMMFWTSLALLAYARIVSLGLTTRRCVAFGAFAGLAVATKDQAAAAFAAAAIVLTPLWRLDVNGRWRDAAVAAGGGAAALLVGSGFAVDPERYLAHIRWAVTHNAAQNPGIINAYIPWFAPTAAGVVGLAVEISRSMIAFVGPVVVIAAVGGVVGVALRERRQLAWILPALGCFVLFVALQHYFWRYGMPLVMITAILAARGFVMFRPRHVALRCVRAAALAVACLWPAVVSVAMVREMQHDTRLTAAAWLAQSMRTGERLATFGAAGILPHVPPAIEVLALPSGRGDENEAALQRERPEFVITLPDWTSGDGMERSGRMPAATDRGLRSGALGYVPAAAFTSTGLFQRARLDYPTISPPIRVYVRRDLAERVSSNQRASVSGARRIEGIPDEP